MPVFYTNNQPNIMRFSNVSTTLQLLRGTFVWRTFFKICTWNKANLLWGTTPEQIIRWSHETLKLVDSFVVRGIEARDERKSMSRILGILSFVTELYFLMMQFTTYDVQTSLHAKLILLESFTKRIVINVGVLRRIITQSIKMFR